MGGMASEQKLELHPNGVIIANLGTAIEIVLEPDLGKFTWVISNVRRYPPTRRTIKIASICVFVVRNVARHVVGPDCGHPAFAKAVRQLRIESVVGERLGRNE